MDRTSCPHMSGMIFIDFHVGHPEVKLLELQTLIGSCTIVALVYSPDNIGFGLFKCGGCYPELPQSCLQRRALHLQVLSSAWRRWGEVAGLRTGARRFGRHVASGPRSPQRTCTRGQRGYRFTRSQVYLECFRCHLNGTIVVESRMHPSFAMSFWGARDRCYAPQRLKLKR